MHFSSSQYELHASPMSFSSIWWPQLYLVRSTDHEVGSYRLLWDPSWNVMAHGDASEGKWRGNWRMEGVASTLHTTSEHGVSSITTADAHTSAASSRLNWRPRRFKWTLPFRRKTKYGFCAWAITFQLASTSSLLGPHIFLSIQFSNTLCFSPYTRHRVSAGIGNFISWNSALRFECSTVNMKATVH